VDGGEKGKTRPRRGKRGDGRACQGIAGHPCGGLRRAREPLPAGHDECQ